MVGLSIIIKWLRLLEAECRTPPWTFSLPDISLAQNHKPNSNLNLDTNLANPNSTDPIP